MELPSLAPLLRRITGKVKDILWPVDRLERLRALGLRTGRNLHLMEYVSIDESHCWHIEIGDDVTIAPRAVILAHDASTRIHLGVTRIGRVRIGSQVFIGAGAVILPGVTIGDRVVIGAGSVVSRDVPGNSLAAGSPAKVLMTLDQFLEQRRAEMQAAPCFGGEYLLQNGVSEARKAEMNARMAGGIGYLLE